MGMLRGAAGSFARGAGYTLGKRVASYRSPKRYAKIPRPLNTKTAQYGLAKRVQRDSIGAPAFNSLLFKEITDIPRGTDLNTRERDAVLTRGVRLRMEFQITTPSNGERYWLVWAVIQFKNRTPGTAVTQADINADFFRGANTSRNVNFDSVALATHKLTYAVNTDKYRVFGRGQVSATGTGDQAEPANFSVDDYVRIPSKCHYDDATDLSCHNPIVFVYWFMKGVTNSTVAASTQTTGTMSLTTYYRDVI